MSFRLRLYRAYAGWRRKTVEHTCMQRRPIRVHFQCHRNDWYCLAMCCEGNEEIWQRSPQTITYHQRDNISFIQDIWNRPRLSDEMQSFSDICKCNVLKSFLVGVLPRTIRLKTLAAFLVGWGLLFPSYPLNATSVSSGLLAYRPLSVTP